LRAYWSEVSEAKLKFCFFIGKRTASFLLLIRALSCFSRVFSFNSAAKEGSTFGSEATEKGDGQKKEEVLVLLETELQSKYQTFLRKLVFFSASKSKQLLRFPCLLLL
jgi:hypothetical protein